jgi:hypothetical protein
LRLPETSTLIGRVAAGGVGQVSFSGLPDPSSVLRELLAIHAAALRAPLPLFPAASRRYAEAFMQQKPPEIALSAARDAFTLRPNSDSIVDQSDAYVFQLYPDFDSVLRLQASEFTGTAQRLYAALFAHRTDS